jgi:hypothetical protein
VFTAPQVCKVPFQVSQHHQIEPSVVVQIDPCGGGGPTAAAGAGSLGHIRKGAVAVVVVKMIAAIPSHVQVFVTVIVIVADGHAHVIAGTGQSRLLGNVYKGSVRVLMVEPIPVCSARLPRYRARCRRVAQRGAAGKENVQPPIIVVVKQRSPRAHGLDQVLLRSVVCLAIEMDTAGFRNIDKFARLGGGRRVLCLFGPGGKQHSR